MYGRDYFMKLVLFDIDSRGQTQARTQRAHLPAEPSLTPKHSVTCRPHVASPGII